MNQLKFITIAVTHEEAEFLTSSLERKRQKDEDWIKIFLVFSNRILSKHKYINQIIKIKMKDILKMKL